MVWCLGMFFFCALGRSSCSWVYHMRSSNVVVPPVACFDCHPILCSCAPARSRAIPSFRMPLVLRNSTADVRSSSWAPALQWAAIALACMMLMVVHSGSPAVAHWEVVSSMTPTAAAGVAGARARPLDVAPPSSKHHQGRASAAALAQRGAGAAHASHSLAGATTVIESLADLVCGGGWGVACGQGLSSGSTGVVARRARAGHLFLTIPHPCLFLPPLTKQSGVPSHSV